MIPSEAREQALESLRKRPETFNVAELWALHNALDSEIKEIRQAMGLIDQEIGRREHTAASLRRGSPNLTQRIGHGQ